jgi:predicted nucleic acid-binding protein
MSDSADTGRSLIAFVDSSAILAIVNRADPTHDQAIAAYPELIDAGYHLFTTDYVIAETTQLIDLAFGADVARQWLRTQRLPVYHADEQDVKRAIAQMTSATPGARISMTDAVSSVVMERLGVSDAFAVDPEFMADGA